MIIAGSDIETTGLEWGDHRIVEVYVGLWDSDTRTRLDHKRWRINPQRSIAAAAQAVHGISASELEGEPIWSDVATDIREWLESADLVVGHNWNGFDAPFINYELKRVSKPPLTKPTFDTMLQGRWATPMGQVPNLGALCWACEVEYDPAKAHAADYDVGVMMECFFRGLDWGWFKPNIPAVAA